MLQQQESTNEASVGYLQEIRLPKPVLYLTYWLKLHQTLGGKERQAAFDEPAGRAVFALHTTAERVEISLEHNPEIRVPFCQRVQ